MQSFISIYFVERCKQGNFKDRQKSESHTFLPYEKHIFTSNQVRKDKSFAVSRGHLTFLFHYISYRFVAESAHRCDRAAELFNETMSCTCIAHAPRPHTTVLYSDIAEYKQVTRRNNMTFLRRRIHM